MSGRPIYVRHARLPGPSLHSFVPPPAGPFGLPFPHLESLHPVHLFVTSYESNSVQFDGTRAALKGHDTGPGVPHVSYPPNAGTVLAIAFASYKPLLTIARVMVEGLPIAAFDNGLMELCASPVPESNCLAINGVWVTDENTVFVGVDAADKAAALKDFIIDVIVGGVVDLAFKVEPLKSVGKRIVGKFAKAETPLVLAAAEAVKNAIKSLTKDTIKGAVKGDLKWKLPATGAEVKVGDGKVTFRTPTGSQYSYGGVATGSGGASGRAAGGVPQPTLR